MLELTIHGRGGQGGVTLAKLIASAYFERGMHVQAFGVYAAERSGAPVQAFVRVSDDEITNHNQIREPNHVIVLDRTLIGPGVVAAMKPDGWLILNTAETPESFAEVFPGRQVATVDATAIALSNGLGTRTVPIVNTTLLGAVARVFDLGFEDVEAALRLLKFGGANHTAAHTAFEQVRTAHLSGEPVGPLVDGPIESVAGLLDPGIGGMPKIQTGQWATHKPLRHQLTPPCNHGCPAGNDVQGFIQALAREDSDAALAILMKTTPFPAICGRVCPAPCTEVCNRAAYDEAINVPELERYAAEHGRYPEPTQPWRGERVAVVGSGPAGLSATYHLARLGYRVTLIEAGEELGGVMRTGIPAYRLPRDVLDDEISHILRHGVDVRTDVAVDRAALLDLTRTFDTVFVATGLQEARALDLGAGSERFVIEGIDFLDRARRFQMRVEDEQVVVIGGGNTAMDAARTARRLGARTVRVVYRRTRAQMPAIREEVDEAVEEGIELDELVSPLRLHRDGVGAVLTCQRMKLGEPDASGRPRPIPDTSEDAVFDIRCDRIVLALGQSADMSILPEGAEIRNGQLLLGVTDVPVFMGGDFASNDGTVSAAIGSDRRAALHIHRTLTGEDLFPPPEPPVAKPEQVTMHVFEHEPREDGVFVEPERRRASFTEVRRGYVDEPGHRPAMEEADRCFSCGVCNLCDRCVDYCPEGILVREGTAFRFDYDYCKGCGVCASQCPRGVIYMAEL